MSIPNHVIKSTAKTALRPAFTKSVIACTVLVFVLLIILYLSSIIGFIANEYIGTAFYFGLMLLLFFPLFLGVLSFFRRLQWGMDDSLLLIFRYFSDAESYRRAWRFTLLFLVRVLVPGLVFFLPSILVSVMSKPDFYQWIGVSVPVWSTYLGTVSFVLRVISIFLVLAGSLRYYTAPFLFAADEDRSPAQIMALSGILSKRTALDFFFLVLSFTLWILLSFLLAPVIFTLPYFFMSYLVHCRFAVSQYNAALQQMNPAKTYPAGF